ncbi:MAG TPA: hypothetical protein DEP53_14055 [Bacteroidetes bacterium]|nr:hypothetical protein [Bacteroidota bacterium]
MPTIVETLGQAKAILTTSTAQVEQTVAHELLTLLGGRADIKRSSGLSAPAGSIRLAVVQEKSKWSSVHPALDSQKEWMMVRAKNGGGIEILASRPHLLYYLYTILTEDWKGLDIGEFEKGKITHPTFKNLRPAYDVFLTQHARTVRNFNREEHIRNLARMGFSHVEANGLAFAVPFERGPQGELLHRFYTYCPSLDQFVSSKLNKGTYDDDYLQANLNFLRTNAELGQKYGLTPGLVCFEPRSVPDNLLQKYPMLRGARVDHPIRSWHPRYNLSIAHPVVRDHYAEMMEKIVKEVPSLEYISIWSNDSGAGFEYTSSLYVGRNGGGYVIREWKGDTEIAESAANNLVRFLRILRDAGRKVNPKFRTLIRLEPFWAEHEYIWKQLGDGLDVEVSSLVTKGWKLAYQHPKYKEAREIHGTALHNQFVDAEKPIIEELRKKKAEADVYFSPGTIWNHEPLLGIPFPSLVFDKLKDLAKQGVTTPCYNGSATPPSFAPYNINQELVRAFQADGKLDLDAFMHQKAAEWIGDDLAADLVKVWRYSDEAYRSFPLPIWIYSSWSVWYRISTRPIVPNIEAISEEDRSYYEQFLLATSHNRCRIDFRYDVGFDLVDPAHAHHCLGLINRDLFPQMEAALKLLKTMKARANSDAAQACVQDTYDRMRALYCWYRSQRNVTAWVAGVHSYIETTNSKVKKESRKLLREMVLDEIENTRDLLNLWETSKTNWMILSDVGETTFIYYKNFGEQLKRKIALMKGHENDEPYVDPNFQWRVPGFTDAPAT